MNNANLVENGIKDYTRFCLKKCNKVKKKYNNLIINISLFGIFVFVVYAFLYYKIVIYIFFLVYFDNFVYKNNIYIFFLIFLI